MPEASAARKRLIDIVRERSFSTGGETKLVSGRSTGAREGQQIINDLLAPFGAVQYLLKVLLDALIGDLHGEELGVDDGPGEGVVDLVRHA